MKYLTMVFIFLNLLKIIMTNLLFFLAFYGWNNLIYVYL